MMDPTTAIVFGVGMIGLLVGYAYWLLGPEWVQTLIERVWRRRNQKRRDDEDEDPRGIGGGYA